MRTTTTRGWLAGLALAISGNAFGLGAILHLQGEKGDREAFFADVRVISNRTPMDQILSPISVREITVTAVYENPAKPEWVTMHLQFECASPFPDEKGRLRPPPPDTGTAKFKIGPGSYLVKRVDLAADPMSETDWNTSSAPMLVKARRIACNDIEFDDAIRKSMNKQTKSFDEKGFGDRAGKLGLPKDLMLIGMATPPEFLDFAWTTLWWDTALEGKRPDPSGKWSRLATKAEKEAAQLKLEKMRAEKEPQLKAARESLEANIAKMEAEFEFQEKAAKMRGGRSLSNFETNLVHTWVGLPEERIVDTMGNPEFHEGDNRRFFKYTSWFDNTAQVIDLKSGATWEEGNFSECNVEFVTMQDKAGQWRVADTRVWVRENALGSGAAWCYGLLKTPN